MPERPILLFGEKQRAERKKKSAPPGKMHFPGKTRQMERLSPKFSSLQAALENGNLILQNSPNSIETEYTLVFEIVGSVEAFYAAVNSLNDGSQRKNTPGGYAEIVLDLQREIDSDADFYQLRDTGERADAETVSSKLYCVSTNGRALQELLSLWQAYTNNEDFEFPYKSLVSDPRKVSDTVHKFFGYGLPDFERAYTCTAQKAIILGFGELKDGEADIFSLPLPFNFAQNKIYRRLTITLAYFSPMVFNRQRYRAMQLWATLENDSENWKRKDVQWQAALRGTLQHEIFENDNPEIWDEENSLKIKVNCRNDADAKNKLPIRYALMVSFEIKGNIDIDVYTKIANKIRPRVQL